MTKKGRLAAALGLTVLSAAADADEPLRTEPFEFVSAGRRLLGALDRPTAGRASGIVVFVHGHGRTDAVAGNWYGDLRRRFADLGLASLIWDKAGCGRSEGRYDHDQTVQSGADEVLAAIEELRRRKVPGSDRVGLWGISRAGWICPLVIQRQPSVAFWISVSGTDEKESFGYLLETNLRIEGRSASQARALVDEWRRGMEVFRKGGSFAANQKATANLRLDPFFREFFGRNDTEAAYLADQRRFIAEGHVFDDESGLMIYVPGLRDRLRAVRCPVLALFGEKDSNVDWRSTAALYKETIPLLTLKTFPGCNHNLRQCRTGGFRETMTGGSQPACEGYHDAIVEWVKAIEFAAATASTRRPVAGSRRWPRAGG